MSCGKGLGKNVDNGISHQYPQHSLSSPSIGDDKQRVMYALSNSTDLCLVLIADNCEGYKTMFLLLSIIKQIKDVSHCLN